MSGTYFGWLNALKTGALTASSAASGLSPQNLQIDTGAASVAWQTDAGVVSGVTLTCTMTTISTWRLFGLFRTNLTSTATVLFQVYSGATLIWTSGSLAGPVGGYGQVVIAAVADQVGDKVVITITDTANPDGFLNIPLAYAGPAWNPLSAPSWSTAVGRDDATDEVVSRGGQEYPIARWTRRRWEIDFARIRAAETFPQVAELDRVSRAGGNVMFIPSTTSSDMQREAIFGRLKAAADIGYPYQAADARSWRARITERL